MENLSNLLKVGALCSLASAITTATLMYGPNPPTAETFEAAQTLHQNGLYMMKKWVLFLHPQFAFIAAITASFMTFKKAPTATCFGLMFLFIWAYTEMSQQAYLIDALNQYWRPAYAAAADADKAAWATLIKGSEAVSDSYYFLLIYGFALGSLIFGFALQKQKRAGLIIGLATSLIGLMSLIAFLFYYAGFSSLSDLVGGWYSWIYGPLQISVRLALGWWLFDCAMKIANSESHQQTT